MEFSRQEYWRGLPFPSPGDFSDPGIEPMFPALAGRFFSAEQPGKPQAEYLFQISYANKLLSLLWGDRDRRKGPGVLRE